MPGGLPGTVGGLQLKPKKFSLQAPKTKPRPSAFTADEDDELGDDASDRARVSRELQRGSGGSLLGRAAIEAAQAAALAQDASVFDYDGVYDTMQQERSAMRQAAKPKVEEKKARYIDSIMLAHKKREMENEKVFERKMVKEAEEEAHMYGDKERFMTSAYRKKLAAREEYEAELKRQDEQDSKNDVTKRADLSGFYSNLLHDRLAPDAGGSSSSAAPVDSAPAAQAPHSDTSGAEAVAQQDGPPPAPARKELVDEDLATAISTATAELQREGAKSAPVAPTPAPAANYERRNDSNAVQSARERYLERKRQRKE